MLIGYFSKKSVRLHISITNKSSYSYVHVNYGFVGHLSCEFLSKHVNMGE